MEILVIGLIKMIAQELLVEMTVDRIDAEISDRIKLLDQMVGWLYPSILSDELEQLYCQRLVLLR